MVHAPAAVGEPQRAEIIPDATRELIRFEFMPQVEGQPRDAFPVAPCNPRTGRRLKFSDTAESLAETAGLTGKTEAALLLEWRRNFRPLVPPEFASMPEAYFANVMERRRRRRRHARRAGGVLLVRCSVGSVAVALDFFESDSAARRFARAIVRDGAELQRAIADGLSGLIVLSDDVIAAVVASENRGKLRNIERNPQNSVGANRAGRSSRRVSRGSVKTGEIGGVA